MTLSLRSYLTQPKVLSLRCEKFFPFSSSPQAQQILVKQGNKQDISLYHALLCLEVSTQLLPREKPALVVMQVMGLERKV